MEKSKLPHFESNIPADIMEDLKAVCQTLAAGKSIDPELRQRLREEGDRVREQIFQKHGVLHIGLPAIRELRDGE